MRHSLVSFAAWAVAMSFAAQAQALTFYSVGSLDPLTTGGDPLVAGSEAVLVTFSAAAATGVALTPSGSYASVFTQDGLNYSPFEAAQPAGDSTAFYALGPGGSLAVNFNAYDATQKAPIQTASVYWGSIDPYNSLTVIDAHGVDLGTITGADVSSTDNGDQGLALTNRRVYVSVPKGDSIGGLVFASTGISYEFDTIGVSSVALPPNDGSIVAALPAGAGDGNVLGVPEPATWAVMLIGLGMVGGLARRRRPGLAI